MRPSRPRAPYPRCPRSGPGARAPPSGRRARRRVRRQLGAFATVVIGEKHETPWVHPLEQDDARARLAVASHRRQGHGRGLRDLGVHGLGEPALELRDRIGVDFVLAEGRALIFAAQICGVHFGAHWRMSVLRLSAIWRTSGAGVGDALGTEACVSARAASSPRDCRHAGVIRGRLWRRQRQAR